MYSTNFCFSNYTDCHCTGESLERGSATRTPCDNNCGFLIPFIVVMFVSITLTFLATMPSTVASLRCVLPAERSLGLGLQTIISRLVGSIPGPVLFGSFIDAACLKHLPGSCGEESGSCLVYDNYRMAMSMFGISLVAKVLSATFYGSGWLASRRSSIPDGSQSNNPGDKVEENMKS